MCCRARSVPKEPQSRSAGLFPDETWRRPRSGEKTSGHFRTAPVHEDGVSLTKIVTIWTPSVHAGCREVRRGISLMILGLKTNCGSDLWLRNVTSQQEPQYFASSLFKGQWTMPVGPVVCLRV